MSRTHPDLSEIATAMTARYKKMLESGTMPGRDSDGNTIDVPLSAAMYGKIMDWLRIHGVTLDPTTGEDGERNDIADMAEALRKRGVAGRLPPAVDDEEVA